jgi:anaerobic ribonucleoside-triphosphate reductase activating protein
VKLSVNHIADGLHAQGPGKRYTIWVQGCSIHCPGCSNKDTWPFEGGQTISIETLVKDIKESFKYGVTGVTITGGEPLDQFKAIYALCGNLRSLPITIFLTTGYTLEQIQTKNYFSILKVLDIICTGPFKENLICKGDYKGSSNQIVEGLTVKGQQELTNPIVLKEIIIEPNGDYMETGFTA